MQPNTRTLLEDMLARCERIANYVEDMTLADYLAQVLVRDAVERNFIALGEIVGRISRNDPGMMIAITSSREILGLRHRIAHGYDAEINDATILTTAQHSVPALAAELRALLSHKAEEQR